MRTFLHIIRHPAPLKYQKNMHGNTEVYCAYVSFGLTPFLATSISLLLLGLGDGGWAAEEDKMSFTLSVLDFSLYRATFKCRIFNLLRRVRILSNTTFVNPLYLFLERLSAIFHTYTGVPAFWRFSHAFFPRPLSRCGDTFAFATAVIYPSIQLNCSA